MTPTPVTPTPVTPTPVTPTPVTPAAPLYGDAAAAPGATFGAPTGGAGEATPQIPSAYAGGDLNNWILGLIGAIDGGWQASEADLTQLTAALPESVRTPLLANLRQQLGLEGGGVGTGEAAGQSAAPRYGETAAAPGATFGAPTGGAGEATPQIPAAVGVESNQQLGIDRSLVDGFASTSAQRLAFIKQQYLARGNRTLTDAEAWAALQALGYTAV